MAEAEKIAFARKLAELIRYVAYLETERETLASMLETGAQHDLSSVGWQTALTSLQKTETYQAKTKKYDPMLQELERAADLREIQAFLDSVPTSRYTN